MIYVSGDIKCIGTMRTVEILVASFPEEEPDGAIGIWGLWGKLVEERYKTGVKRILRLSVRGHRMKNENVPVSSSFSFPYIKDISQCLFAPVINLSGKSE